MRLLLDGLTTSRATFYRTASPVEHVTQPDEAYLIDVPVMPVTGNNTRQSGNTVIAIGGTFAYEGKTTMMDITPEVREFLDRGERIENGHRVIIDNVEYSMAGTDEYDAPSLGFSFIVLKLKEE